MATTEIENNDVELHVLQPKTPVANPNNRPICQGECGQPIPIYPNVPEGYESPEIWKLIDHAVAGIPGVKAVHKVLCLECYRTAWKRRYPEYEVPV